MHVRSFNVTRADDGIVTGPSYQFVSSREMPPIVGEISVKAG